MYEIKYRDESELKDSGIEWVGSIPTDWYIKKLRYLSTIDTGNKDTQDRVDDGEYPFYVRSDTVERINSFSFNGEAILTAGDGVGVGRVFHYVNGKFAYHQRVYKLSDFSYVSGKYLFYYVSENFHKEVMKLSAKSTVDSLRRPMFSNFPIVFPISTEQQKIANFLDIKTAQFDDIIAKKEQLIKKLEEAKKSLISEVVTGKVKIVDGQLVPRDVYEMNDSGVEWLGFVPKDWDVKPLKYLLKINPPKSEVTNLKRECSFVPMNKIHNEIVETDELKIIKEVYSGYTYFKEHDIIMAKVTPCFENGDIAIAVGLKNGIGFGTTEINVFRIKKNNLKYIFYCLQESHFKNYGVSHMTGVAGLKRIPTDYFSEYKICVPPEDEQKLLGAYLEGKSLGLRNLKSKMLKEIDILKQAKQSLISEAITGKIDLRDWEIIEEGELQ